MPDTGVVLTDDHPIVLRGLAQLLDSEPGLAVLAACPSGEEMLAAVERHRPAVLVLDFCLPGRDGIALLGEIAVLSPGTRVVIFAAALDEERVVEALHRGAAAVLFKDTPADELVGCIRRVAAGAAWIAPEPILPPDMRAGELSPSGSAALLSPREREIAELVARGERNKEIAWQLGLAEGTVKLHISRAFKKLRVGNRVGLSRALALRG
jgi:DNA-binding NarL/FixJ family response regulator